MITSLLISGMTCNACVRHVDDALRGLRGVTAVEVDLAAGRARVVHDPHEAPLASLIAAVQHAGYDSVAPSADTPA